MGGINNLSKLKLAIISDTKVFLRGLESGASNDQLVAIARRIREKEHELLHQEGALIDPEMWRILHSRLMKRNLEIIDPFG
ncbi:MAG TPA: hypothetical protein VN616_11070 [Puia sp.]|nr:hypothetical protein [Puia sp.]